MRKRLMRSAMLGLVSLALAAGAQAQETRDELFERADALAAGGSPAEAVPLLYGVIHPDSGTVGDDLWLLGVELMAQAQASSGDPATAELWLRWAIRQQPNFEVDQVFSPDAFSVFQSARDFVAGDTLSRRFASWSWDASPDPTAGGTLEVGILAPPGQSLLLVEGGLLSAGQSLDLPPGSYQLVASATEYDTLRVAYEILPSVTTAVSPVLTRSPVVAPVADDPPAQDPPVDPPPAVPDSTVVDVEVPPGGSDDDVAEGGGGFPIAVLGLLGAAGGAAVFLLMGGKPPVDPCQRANPPPSCPGTGSGTGTVTIVYVPNN